MDINYLKIIDKVNWTKEDIQKLWEQTQMTVKMSFEDKEAYCIVESIVDMLDIASYKLKRLSLPVIEGKLQIDKSRGKFELVRQDDGKGIGFQFSCGSYLEVYDEEEKEWRAGRVEHTTKDGHMGYYFVCSDMGNPFLYTGMVCRVRMEN